MHVHKFAKFLTPPHPSPRYALLMVIHAMLLAAGCFACLESPGEAEQPTRYDSPQAWFDATWQRAGEPLRFEWTSIAWSQEDAWIPPTAEIERLRREVPGRPDHPERTLLEAIEQKLAGRAPTGEFEFVFGGKGEFRLNHHSRYDPNDYYDRIVTRDAMWGLTYMGLGHFDIGSKEPGYDLATFAAVAGQTYSYFLDGGLWTVRLNQMQPDPVRLNGNELVIECRGGPHDQRATVVAQWDAEASCGFIQSIRFREPRSSDGSTVIVESSGWEYDSFLQRWAAEEVRSKRADGGVVHVWRRGRVGSVDAERFAALIRPPEPDGVDPVRGKVTFKVIEDHRASKRNFTSLTNTGPVVTAMPPDSSTRDARWVTRTGWIVAACLAASLVFLRLRTVVLRRAGT